MTTIAVVRKGDFVSIAADTQTTLGSRKETAKYIVNNEKIIEHNESFIAVTGWGTFQLSLHDILQKLNKKIQFGSIDEIFKSSQIITKEMKENYFLRPDGEDSDDFETMHGDLLIANPNGIFGLSSYRYAQEFSRFYASGSGSEYALGAMFAIYDSEDKTAEDIVKIGVSSGIEFDDGSDFPINCYTVKLKR